MKLPLSLNRLPVSIVDTGIICLQTGIAMAHAFWHSVFPFHMCHASFHLLQFLKKSSRHFVFLFSVQLCIWGGVTRRALSYVCELPWVPLLLNIRVRVDLGRYTQTKNYRWRNWDRWEIKLLSVMGLWLHWHKNTRWFPSINLRTYVSRQHISVEICFI